MKARTKAQKRASKRGRPRLDGMPRTETGRISRSSDAQEVSERLACEVATWKRRQEDPSLTVDEARKQEHGSVIHRWRLEYQAIEKRFPDGRHPNTFTALHLDTAERFHRLYADYHVIIGARQTRSSSDLTSIRGADSADPFEESRANREAAITASYREARGAILESGPLGMMAVMAIIVENKDCPDMIGDLRGALNRLAVLWKLRAAA